MTISLVILGGVGCGALNCQDVKRQVRAHAMQSVERTADGGEVVERLNRVCVSTEQHPVTLTPRQEASCASLRGSIRSENAAATKIVHAVSR